MSDNPYSSAFLALRRASERLAKDQIGKTDTWLAGKKTTINPSHSDSSTPPARQGVSRASGRPSDSRRAGSTQVCDRAW